MAYDIDVSLEIKGEQGATVDQFIEESNETTTEVNTELNASWVKVKAQLPADQQVAAEARVRAETKVTA